MTESPPTVRYYERLGLFGYAIAVAAGHQVFYCELSLALQFAKAVLRLDISRHAAPIWFGSIDRGTGIRRCAYERAKEALRKMEVSQWVIEVESGIDHALIAEKFFMEFFYYRFEFLGFSIRHAEEKHDRRHVFFATSPELAVLAAESGVLEVKRTRSWRRLQFIGAMLAIPLFWRYFAAKYRVLARDPLRDAIICEVDDPKTYEMFRTLFGGWENTKYTIHAYYLQFFLHAGIDTSDFRIHGIDQEARDSLRQFGKSLLSFGCRHSAVLSKYGDALFGLFKVYAMGHLSTERATNSLYLTFEHMSTAKAVRNELLRVSGNKSAFLPYNVYAVDHLFVPEYRYNYDILCSPGRVLEKVYALQSAKTQVMLPIGPYSSHKGSEHDVGKAARTKLLREFKAGCPAITILSTGINDLTYTAELKLMQFACRLAKELDVRIFVRQKPMVPPKKYEDFYVRQCASEPNILLTAGEYALFDFLEVTDLFVAASSSSAIDLCAAGAAIFSIDFWHDRDMYLWQTIVDGVLLPEEKAFETVKAWVEDASGSVRAEHASRMAELSSLVAYKMDGVERYSQNLLSSLAPWLPKVFMCQA